MLTYINLKSYHAVLIFVGVALHNHIAIMLPFQIVYFFLWLSLPFSVTLLDCHPYSSLKH